MVDYPERLDQGLSTLTGTGGRLVCWVRGVRPGAGAGARAGR